MGQYHILVNLDKKEVVSPEGLGLGLKQYEHTACEGSLSDAMYLLVMSSPANGGGDFPLVENISGRWCGDRVVVVGDYTTQESAPEIPYAETIYQIANETYKNITPDIRSAFEKIFDIFYHKKMMGHLEFWSRVSE